MRYWLARILVLLLCLNTALAWAQRENNIWYFGHKVGLDFNQSPPRPLTNGAMTGREGCATVADNAGNLLFYTNGDTIYNKNHAIMANGTNIGGHYSSRQGPVILPQPGSKFRYYVFTSDAKENNYARGFRYCVVDMQPQGGLGEVTTKNVFVQALSEENLAAVGSCNCPDTDRYWIMTDKLDDPGRLYVYQLDKNGLDRSPAISVLPDITEITYFKFSPAGNRIAFIGTKDGQQPVIGIADFDFSTGLVTNLKVIPRSSNQYHRALEFSGNGQVLYYHEIGEITQYNLAHPTIAQTINTAIVLNESYLYEFSAMQLASDGKIYVAQNNGDLTVVEQPNQVGLGCSLIIDAINSQALFGLPSLIASSLYQNDSLRLNLDAGPDKRVCQNSPTRLGGRSSEALRYRWSPGTFLSDSTSSHPTFQYPGSVEQEITLPYVLAASDGVCTRRDTVLITVLPRSAVAISGSRSVCPRVTEVVYQATVAAGHTYRWRVSGGSIVSGQGTATIQVNWGPTNPNAQVEVTAISPDGCESPPAILPVRINVELATETPQGPDSVCANRRSNNIYRVTPTNGSVYTWFLTGGTLVAGQGTAQVTVDWATQGPHQIWLQEQSITIDTVCYGASDTLRVIIYQDLLAPALHYVSVNLPDEQTVEIHTAPLPRGSVAGTLYRRELGQPDWQTISFNTDTTTYADAGLRTDETVYEYRLEHTTACGEKISSTVHRTIRLIGLAAEENGQITLTWTPYEGWPQGVERYEIWRLLDNDAGLKLVGQVDGSTLRYLGSQGLDGFEHRFRVKAIARQTAYVSWSNQADLIFRHELMPPNVFTPNGDGTNDTFAIRRLELYPDNQLTVYNRWGRVIYSAEGYRNQWAAPDLATGTYYYQLNLRRTSKLLKGWVELSR